MVMLVPCSLGLGRVIISCGDGWFGALAEVGQYVEVIGEVHCDRFGVDQVDELLLFVGVEVLEVEFVCVLDYVVDEFDVDLVVLVGGCDLGFFLNLFEQYVRV